MSEGLILILCIVGIYIIFVVGVVIHHFRQKKKKKLPKPEVNPNFPNLILPELEKEHKKWDEYHEDFIDTLWDEIKYQEFKKELKRLKEDD